MHEQEEKRYNKWIDICDKSQEIAYPLTLTNTGQGEVIISTKGRKLLTLTHEQFETYATNEIVRSIGENNDS